MKILELQFKKNGYDHRQIFRQDDIAIYETATPKVAGLSVTKYL